MKPTANKFKALICLLLCLMFVITGTACSNSKDDIFITPTTTEAVTDAEVEDTTQEQEATAPTVVEDVTISADVEKIAEDTKEDIKEKNDIASDELLPFTADDETMLEPDAMVEQEDIAYNGSNTGTGTYLLGKCTGLTYYSQGDSRWANVIYSKYNSKSQTMKSSACGPTTAAMIVSSSKGAILPTAMAKIAVDNKFRTDNNGTAWAFWPFVADFFNFDFYKETTSFATAEKYLETDKNNDGISDYFVAVSCGSGLFTTSGHYIALVGDKDNTLTVYDPSLYYGKFTTPSRKAAKAVVSGNSVYVSESSFKKYANAKRYWIYSNESGTKQVSSGSTEKPTPTAVSYTRYVATQSDNLNVRSGPGTNYKIVTSLSKGTAVKATKTSGSWTYITSPAVGWVSTAYLSATKVTTASAPTTVKYKTTVGQYYRLKKDTTLYSNGSCTGTKYSYLAKTQVKVVSHYSATVDKVYIVKLGIYRYAKVADYA